MSHLGTTKTLELNPGEKQNGILSPLLSVTNQIWRVANTRQW